MGHMKTVFMDLYYNFDGLYPEGYDHEAYLIDILNKQEYEEKTKTKEKLDSTKNKNSST